MNKQLKVLLSRVALKISLFVALCPVSLLHYSQDIEDEILRLLSADGDILESKALRHCDEAKKGSVLNLWRSFAQWPRS